MAYSCLVGLACANMAAVLAQLWTQLSNMGWTLVDYLNKTTVTVPYTDVSVANDTLTKTSHGLVDGDYVNYQAAGTAIGGLSKTYFYYVVSATENTFKLSATYGGAAINISSQGTGDHLFGEGYRIYSSNGELADRIAEFVKIDWATANTITISAYYKWDASTHVGSGKAYSNGDLTTSETGCTLWVYGDKNITVFANKISTTYDIVSFGHIPKRWWTVLATTQNAEVAGASVVMEVDNTTGFRVNKYYQIVGAALEGRDRVQVTAIDPNVSLTIATLPRNFGAGALIGNTPSTFVVQAANSMSIFSMTCLLDAVGLTDLTSVYSLLYVDLIFTTNSANDPDDRNESAYILQPMFWRESGSLTKRGAIGYIDDIILSVPSTGVVPEDTFGVNEQDTGTSSGSNDATHLNDTAKSWSVNAWANKYLLITGGVGAGQTRKIASNAATQIVINTAFTTIPDATSTYAVADEAWRLLSTAISGVVAAKEII
jgi:hypothetical protein